MAAIFIHFPLSGTLLDKFECSSHEQTAIHPASCEDSSRHPGPDLRLFFPVRKWLFKMRPLFVCQTPKRIVRRTCNRCDRDIFVSFVGYNALTLLQPAGFQLDTIFTCSKLRSEMGMCQNRYYSVLHSPYLGGLTSQNHS